MSSPDQRPEVAGAIAVIGMSGRFPGAANLNAFWAMLDAGQDAVREIPAERWEAARHRGDPRREPNTTASIWAGCLEGLDRFDARFFRISPKEAEVMDPQQRILLETAWEALEDAAIQPSRLAGSNTGVFIGACNDDYSELIDAQLPVLDGYVATGNFFSILSNRLSYYFDFHGPSFTVDTACSSSLVAIHQAVRAIERGECDMALAGGVNVCWTAKRFIAFSAAGMLSKEGKCKTFDQSADGYVRGEGAAVLVLKPLAAAVRDGDPIHGVIRGSALNHGGKTSSLTVTNPNSQADLLVTAIREAGIEPQTIGYVETHGTGTSLGDPIEVLGLKLAFGRLLREDETGRRPAGFCGIGSVKSNIGHLEAAAGIAGVVKVLLAMRHGRLPSTLHVRSVNPLLKLDDSPFYIVTENRAWEEPRSAGGEPLPRRAGVSSFGFGGAYAHLVLEAYETDEARARRPRVAPADKMVLALSARTEDRLRAYALRMKQFLEAATGDEWTELLELQSTLLVGREEFAQRLAIVADSRVAAIDGLDAYLDGRPESRARVLAGRAGGQNPPLESSGGRDLASLAASWVHGTAIEWAKHGLTTAHRRGGVPSYPFSPDRHWIPSGGEGRTAASVRASAADALHPLVDRNESTLTQYRFGKTVTGAEFFISDHHVLGRLVLPGVACLEMARAAGELVGEAPIGAIKDVVWSRAFVIGTSQRRLHATLTPSGSSLAFRITSGVAADEEVHAQGRLLNQNDARATGQVTPGDDARDTLSGIRLRCARTVGQAAIYERFSTLGLDLGPSFRSLEEVHLGTGEALGRLRLPAHLEPHRAAWVLHPALIDGVLQTAIQIAEAGDSQLHIPFALDRLDLLAPIPATGYVHAVQVGDSTGSRSGRRFNIRLLDDSGVVVARLTNFVARPAEPARAHTHLYQYAWQAQGDAPAAGPGLQDHRVVLVLANDRAVPELMRRRLAARGATTRTIHVIPGNTFQAGADGFVVDPGCPEHYARLFENLSSRGLAPDCMVHLWNAGAGAPDEPIERGLISVFHLTQAMLRATPKGRLRCVYVFGGPEIRPDHEAVAGLLRSLSLEHSRMACQSIQVAIDDDARLLDAVEDEIRSGAFEVRREAGQRRTPALTRLSPLPENAAPTLLRKGGVYLLSGGLGGVGRIVAGHLARTCGAKLAILGRRPPAAVGVQVAALEAAGATVLYQQCDVADAVAVAAAVAVARERFGRIQGVVQCAGVIEDAFFLNKRLESMLRVLSPKRDGTRALDAATGGDALDFFLLFSSITSVLGNPGQCDYGSANRFLDSFAAGRNALVADGRRVGRTLSIAWPYWADGGMEMSASARQALERRLGLLPLPTERGLEVFDTLLTEAASAFGSCVVVGYGSERALTLSTDAPALEAPAAAPIETSPSSQTDDAVVEALEAELVQIVAATLKMAAGEIDRTANLNTYGFESLALVEFTTALNDRYGLDASPTMFFEFDNVRDVAGHLLRSFPGRFGSLAKTVAPSQAPAAETRTPAAEASVPAPAGSVDDPIAIVGMSGIFPQSPDLGAFWENLAAGRDLVTEIPADRWDWREFDGDPATEPNKTNIRWGGFIDDVDKFDADFFKVSPREAQLMDPQQRLMLEVVWKAIEDAGYRATELARRTTGLILGVSTDDYHDMARRTAAVEPYTTTGSVFNILPNRISFLLNLTGPSFAVDTASSSSLVAMHQAMRAIENGECDVAIAGGVNVMLSPYWFVSFGKAGMLSPDGRCKTFDKDANGYVRGEGAGAIVMMRLSQAMADGAHVYGVVKGSAVSHGGKAASLTAPNLASHVKLLSRVYEDAGVDPATLTYIEAHGTGTSLGDPVEVDALQRTFAALGRRSTGRLTGYCGLGSVKTNIGHLEAGAGIAGVIKVLLAMKHRRLPASLHCHQLNPYIRLDGSPFYVVTQTRDWEQLADAAGAPIPRRAGVSSFGFGGAYAHVLIEESGEPTTVVRTTGRRQTQVVVLSARNEERLARSAQLLLGFLSGGTAHDAGADGRLQPLVEADISRLICRELGVADGHLQANVDLADYGITPQESAQVVDALNERYGLALPVDLLGERRSLEALAAHLCRDHEASVRRVHGGPTPDASAPAARADISLNDLAYTLQVGREEFEARLAIVAADLGDLCERLSNYCGGAKDGSFVFHGFVPKARRDAPRSDHGAPDAAMRDRIPAEIARAWVAGAVIDWQALDAHGPRGRRIALPAYPFARQRHWVTESMPLFGAPSRSHPGHAPLHPMLDSNESSLDRLLYRKALGARDLYLRDHVVAGRMTLPGRCLPGDGAGRRAARVRERGCDRPPGYHVGASAGARGGAAGYRGRPGA